MSDNSTLPLCVDLDGTLVRGDTLQELLLVMARVSPGRLFCIPFWLFRGRAFCKEKIAEFSCQNWDPSHLLWNREFLAYLLRERERGRRLFLVTGANRRVAEAVSACLGIFEEVIASDEKTNLTGKRKAQELVARFGEKGFVYAGNSAIDWPVWEKSACAIVVGLSAAKIRQLQSVVPLEQVFPLARLRS
ncbi:haloacid dehalogenase-like hydrolase [Candidatus Methylacidithermus pantelleriae]|uniref:Uncharacterized protein n=1 Tax=Candidatus Methylacidithermus pantelleriae TaxID=2744239 RepID=A0A8J2BNS5_9BACT|nr:haloacid dehalogenase-like hydrolase [Candidatus Methylacidithermus pantelleriae]CAF0694682.1 hypothetical protein MPNT_170033 [Candidatus Methylacidithermus pantelleriae]